MFRGTPFVFSTLDNRFLSIYNLITIQYDDRGNLVAKCVYDYTTTSLDSVVPTEAKVYNYSTGWEDKLVSVNTLGFIYDQWGNLEPCVSCKQENPWRSTMQSKLKKLTKMPPQPYRLWGLLFAIAKGEFLQNYLHLFSLSHSRFAIKKTVAQIAPYVATKPAV